MDPKRRSKRLRKASPHYGRPSRSARKVHTDAHCKGSSESGKSVNSSSTEWHSEQENPDSATDIDKDDTSPIGVGKPSRCSQKPQVSARGHWFPRLSMLVGVTFFAIPSNYLGDEGFLFPSNCFDSIFAQLETVKIGSQVCDWL